MPSKISHCIIYMKDKSTLKCIDIYKRMTDYQKKKTLINDS